MPRDEMRAVAIDQFGSPDNLSVRTVPMPELEPNEILIRVESAGVGIWDVAECQGWTAKQLGLKPEFPWVLGSEGAGKVAAAGDQGSRFPEGAPGCVLHLGTN